MIHAFAVPSFGIKIDAVPGKLNETWFNARKDGIYYGQCSRAVRQGPCLHAHRRARREPGAVRPVVAALQVGIVDDANATLPPL